MIINHNVSALNTYNKLTVNNTNSSKSLEKLSSGLRINRAGDDAAGLAISEKMRAQIRGLDQAGSNAQNAISLVQTAEGGLNESHSILQRMRELAVQSATDTNTADDRSKIQSEVDQLARELTRISNTTEFNTQNLLAGGFNGVYHIGANANQNLRMNIGSMDAYSLGVAASSKSTANLGANTAAAGLTSIASSGRGLEATTGTGYTIQAFYTAATAGAVSLNQNTSATVTAGSMSVVAASFSYTGTDEATYIIRVDTTSITGMVSGVEYSTDGGVTFTKVSLDIGSLTAALGNNEATVVIDGITLTFSAGTDYKAGDRWSFDVKAATVEFQLRDEDGKLVGNSVIATAQTDELTIGDTANGKTITINFDMAAVTPMAGGTGGSALSTSTFAVNETRSSAAITSNGYVTIKANTVLGIDVSSQGAANEAITTINKAIDLVSQERSKMGALQNRLEHTIDNLSTASENMTASESRIRDVDMAKEMMNYQKNSILAQAATSMLAQANQMPQNVLKLLG